MPRHAVVLLLFVSAAWTKSIPSFAGPYIAYMNRMMSCGDNDTAWRDTYGSLRVTHFNPAKPFASQLMSGAVSLPFDLDDTFWIGVVMHKRSDNEWKKNYLVLNRIPMGACSGLRANLPAVFKVVFKPKSMTGRCVIAKGNYVVDNEPVVWNLPNFPQLPYGNYYVQVSGGRLRSKALLTACADIVVIAKP